MSAPASRRFTRALSVTELLVSIAALLVLISAAVIGVNKARLRGYDAVAVACAKSVADAQTKYHADTDTYAAATAQLDAGMMRTCRTVTVVTSGPINDKRFVNIVFHPLGEATYTVTESGARRSLPTAPTASTPVTLSIVGGRAGCNYVYTDPSAGGTGQMPCGNDYVSFVAPTTGTYEVSVTAYAQPYNGWPVLALRQGGVTLATVEVTARAASPFSFGRVSVTRSEPLDVVFTNDACCGPEGAPDRDRNVYVTNLTLR